MQQRAYNYHLLEWHLEGSDLAVDERSEIRPRVARIKEQRGRLRISQAALASAAAVSRQWLAAVEKGAVERPDPDKLDRVELALVQIEAGEVHPRRRVDDSASVGRRFAEVYESLGEELQALARRIIDGLRELQEIEDEPTARFMKRGLETVLIQVATARGTKGFAVDHRLPADLWRELLEIAKERNDVTDIKATSYVDPEVWWQTPSGRYYNRLQKDLVERKKNIRRVFIYDPDRKLGPRGMSERDMVIQEAEEQARVGIHVHALSTKDIPTAPRDLIVVGRFYAGWLDLDAFRRVLKSNWTTEEEDIMAREVDFELMFEAERTECLGGDSQCSFLVQTKRTGA